jgi:hypothetical protein
MSEGLWNTGPTFCRMTKAALKYQVGINMLSYVDDIVVASKKRENYISDLTETFANMREARLRSNPEKCVFEITREKSSDVWCQQKASKQILTRSGQSLK